VGNAKYHPGQQRKNPALSATSGRSRARSAANTALLESGTTAGAASTASQRRFRLGAGAAGAGWPWPAFIPLAWLLASGPRSPDLLEAPHQGGVLLAR
jgi:hypothetical protein